MPKYYSQCQEDQFLHTHFFNDKRNGTYIELGALNGKLYSNTKFFEDELGWTGVLIEPHPNKFEELTKNRPNNVLANKLVSNSTEELKFRYFVNNLAAVSGVEDTLPQKHFDTYFENERQKSLPQKSIQLKPHSLTEIITATTFKHFDFLSLDVEGHEYEVLQSWDFSVPIDIIMLEVLSENKQDNSSSESKDDSNRQQLCSDILLKNGYVFFCSFKHNEIYVHTSKTDIYPLIPDRFTFIPGKTQMNNDLKRDTEFRNNGNLTKEQKIEKYKYSAFANQECAGFSTLGFYKTSIDDLTTSKYFQNGDGLYVKKIYNDGIYICGCVKNCAKYLQGVFNNIQFISAFFQKCHVVIAYDNSDDGSLTMLKKISQEMNLPITILEGKNTSKYNVVNICNARNSILDYIRKQQQDPKQSKFKYMLMMDMDNVSASPINMQVFHNTMSREKEWDSITFNQQDYYDIWSLSIDDYVCSIWHFESKPYLGAKKENVRKLKQYISEKIKNTPKDELIKCKSAFNGVGLYKIDKFIYSHYEYDIKKTLRYISADEIKRNEDKIGFRFNINSWSEQYDCEHRYFYLKAQKLNGGKLKICIHPQFLFKNYIEKDVEQERSKNCHFVSSRGIMESCDIHSLNANWIQYQDDNADDTDDTDDINKNGKNKQTKRKIIYMRGMQLRQFIKQGGSQNLKKPIVLVTGDCTDTMPNDIFPNHQDFLNFINNKNIIHWFAQNCVLTSHPKLSQIPLGLDYHTMEANKVPEWGPQMSPQMQEMFLKNIHHASKPFWERERKAYGSFQFLMTTRYGKKDRQDALNGVPKDLVYYEPKKINRTQSWKTQSKYAFVLSPLGNGYDCHRTWEAMMLGCIVIMKHNPIDALFTEDMPILLVDEWTDITQELLDKTVETYKQCVADKTFKEDKLTLKYWVDKIHNKV